jgi:hypothetical protein
MKRAIENGWLKMHESGTFCTVHASRRRPFRVSRFAILARLSIFSPPRKPIELPPGFARRFVDDMRAYFAETNLIKRDEIAARQLHALRQHYGGKLRLTDVTQMLLQMRDPGMTVWIYVDTSKQVGDKDHLKVFATEDAAGRWFAEHDPEGVAFEYEVTK